jgi:hypothetical protein
MLAPLSAIAAEQPDNEIVLDGIRQLVIEARDNGFVDSAMQMAMTLGAMACNHSHMENIANEIGSSLFGNDKSHDGHEHLTDHDNHGREKHDTKSCKACKKGVCKKG